LEMAAQAHLEKRIYLEKLLAQGEQGPLALLARRRQGSALLKLNRTLHWLAPLGLNEMVRIITGQNLYESDESFEFGRQICQHLLSETARLSSKHKVRFLLAHLDNTDTARRLARLDLRYFAREIAEQLPTQADELSYTAGVNLPTLATLSPLVRVRMEAILQNNLHRAVTTWRVPATPPPFPDEVKIWLKAALSENLNQGLRFQLNFAYCLDCHSALRGRPGNCSVCHSLRVQQYA
ncbi:MAG: anaerobic ribonucleoside-triphosphate reductase, partial [Acidobacteriota bacterium]